MPTKRPATAKKPAVVNHWHVPTPLVWLVLFLSLVLAGMSIRATARTHEVVADMVNTIDSLRMQKSHARTLKKLTADQLEMAKQEADKRPVAPVLTSVVQFHDGELETMQANLVNPLLAFYATEPLAHALTAVLVERKNASSKDVNVRLFFADGEETAYLWPSTHAKDGVWTPPCARDVATATVDLPLCQSPQ